MKKILIPIFTMIFVMMFSLASLAADINVDYEDSQAKGDTFNVKVSFENDSIDNIDAEVEYDTDALEYISGGSSEGNGGIVKLSGYSEDGKKIEFNLTFKAKAEGITKLFINPSECYDMDGKSVELANKALSVNITESGEGEVTDEDMDDYAEDYQDDQDNAKDDVKDTDEEKGNIALYAGIGGAVLLIIIAVVVIRRRK